MAKAIITVPSHTYAAGSRSVLLPNLTTDDNGVTITFTRESWPLGDGSNILSGVISGSNDGGVTFPIALGAFAWPGGDQINPRTSQPVTTSVYSLEWPQTDNGDGTTTPQRPQQVKADITNTVALTTAITLTGR